MKTYLFNVENGLYAGESFEDAEMLKYEDGVTTVAPPNYDHGQVPVFDPQRNEWTVIPLNIASQLLRSTTNT